MPIHADDIIWPTLDKISSYAHENMYRVSKVFVFFFFIYWSAYTCIHIRYIHIDNTFNLFAQREKWRHILSFFIVVSLSRLLRFSPVTLGYLTGQKRKKKRKTFSKSHFIFFKVLYRTKLKILCAARAPSNGKKFLVLAFIAWFLIYSFLFELLFILIFNLQFLYELLFIFGTVFFHIIISLCWSLSSFGIFFSTLFL